MDLVNQGTIDLVSKPGHKDQHTYFFAPFPKPLASPSTTLVISGASGSCQVQRHRCSLRKNPEPTPARMAHHLSAGVTLRSVLRSIDATQPREKRASAQDGLRSFITISSDGRHVRSGAQRTRRYHPPRS
jgi:hypothetical protein